MYLCSCVPLGGRALPLTGMVRVNKDTGIKNPRQIQVELLTPAISHLTVLSKREAKAYLSVASPFCRKGLVPPLCTRWEETGSLQAVSAACFYLSRAILPGKDYKSFLQLG